MIYIRFNLEEISTNYLIELLEILKTDFYVKGIPGITETNPKEIQVTRFDKITGIEKVEKEYVVEVDGINIDGLKNIKCIDFNRTLINDIHTTYLYFGIEAARKVIIKETEKAYEGTGFINYQHFMLLADLMTNMGNITSLDRYGSNRRDIGPLTRASFEKTAEHLTNAAINNETDPLLGVSSALTMGKMFNGGTGCFDILLNTDLMMAYDKNVDKFMDANNYTIEKNSIFEDVKKISKKIYLPKN